MATIIIHNEETGLAAWFKTNEYYYIYQHMINLGYHHDIAEEIASWAQLASIGEEYYLIGVQIYITE